MAKKTETTKRHYTKKDVMEHANAHAHRTKKEEPEQGFRPAAQPDAVIDTCKDIQQATSIIDNITAGMGIPAALMVGAAEASAELEEFIYMGVITACTTFIRIKSEQLSAGADNE